MNSNIKKRRGYFPDDEDPAEAGIHILTPSSSTGLDAQHNTSNPQYILQHAPSISVNLSISLEDLLDYSPRVHKLLLELAASNLNIPAPILHQLSALDRSHYSYNPPQLPPQNLQHRDTNVAILHKRPRLDSSVPMPASYIDGAVGQDGREKRSLTGQSRQAGNTPRGPTGGFTDTSSSSGWSSSSRIASCLASFCPPCTIYEPQSAYQGLPTTEPYNYSDSRSALEGAIVSLQPQTHLPPNPSGLATSPGEMLSCGDPGIVPQFLSNYPPLQPTTAAAVQPPVSREEMVYPSDSPIDGFGNGPVRNTTGLGIQVQVSPTTTLNSISATYSQDDSSPAFGQYTTFQPLPAASFNQREGYTVKLEQHSLEVYGQTAGYDCFEHAKTVPAKRGPFKDNEKRLATARTRKKGSCIRCRMQRIRCIEDESEEGGQCIPCKKIITNSRIYRLSCLRWKITDVKLFKPGQVKGLEWTLRWKDSVVGDIGSWASHESRTIQVTEGYTGRSVKLQVRQFQPQKGDRLERSWYSNGQRKTKEIPAFAIVDMDAAKKSFDEYIRMGLSDCCSQILGQRMLLWETYNLAMKARGDPSTSEAERKLLANTLDLWMSVRLTTKSFEIVGEETLGMDQKDFDDDSNPLRGKIPLPPVMGAQIDSILIHQVQPQLRRTTLEELQKMTQEKKQKTWLITYLVTFILLHNIALITRHDAEYARKHGMKGRWARERNVKEYNLGANTLLAYFHYCNKGIYPFSAECRDQDLQSLAELDDTAMAVVRYTRQYATLQMRDWQKLWKEDNYENEYYYVSQLFEQNWQPRTMV